MVSEQAFVMLLHPAKHGQTAVFYVCVFFCVFIKKMIQLICPEEEGLYLLLSCLFICENIVKTEPAKAYKSYLFPSYRLTYCKQ